jgi:hypothetical protein
MSTPPGNIPQGYSSFAADSAIATGQAAAPQLFQVARVLTHCDIIANHDWLVPMYRHFCGPAPSRLHQHGWHLFTGKKIPILLQVPQFLESNFTKVNWYKISNDFLKTQMSLLEFGDRGIDLDTECKNT